MAEISIKLERDQVRAVQDDFRPFLVMLCETNIRDSEDDVDKMINEKAIQSLFKEVCKVLDRRLSRKGNIFNIDLTFAQACAWYYLLKKLPINNNQVYLVNLKDSICDTLFKQMLS